MTGHRHAERSGSNHRTQNKKKNETWSGNRGNTNSVQHKLTLRRML